MARTDCKTNLMFLQVLLGLVQLGFVIYLGIVGLKADRYFSEQLAKPLEPRISVEINKVEEQGKTEYILEIDSKIAVAPKIDEPLTNLFIMLTPQSKNKTYREEIIRLDSIREVHINKEMYERTGIALPNDIVRFNVLMRYEVEWSGDRPKPFDKRVHVKNGS